MTLPIIPPFAVKAAYQNSHYATGTYTQGGSQVFSHLVTPPSAGVSAETASDTSAHEVGFAAYSAASEQQVITIGGAPTGGTFFLEWGDAVTGPLAYNATATQVRNALAALAEMPLAAGVYAKQLLTVTGGPTGGTFTVSFGGQTTSAIPYNAAASAVQSALQALSSIGSGNATVAGSAGGPFTVTFAGTLVGPQALMTAAASLTGGTTPGVTVTNVVTGVAPAYPIAVAGNNGGPYTVTFQNALANENVELIAGNAQGLTGGSDPSVTVTTAVSGTIAYANQALQLAHSNVDNYKNAYDSQSGNHF